MVIILVLLAVIVALFAISFFSHRRFGILGLGLAAGAVISPIWGDTASYIVSSTGLIPEGPWVNIVTLSALILIPAILFLFHGYTYKHIVGRVVGSLLFTMLAVAFLVGPIGDTISFSGPAAAVYGWLDANHELVISGGIVIAIADLLFAKPVHKSDKRHR